MRLAPLVLCLAACTASAPPQLDQDDFTLWSPEPEPAQHPLPASDHELRLAPASSVPPTPLQIVVGAPGRQIGDAIPGRVAWLARSARFAVLAHPTADGPSCARRSEHARHQLHDLATGTQERLDTLVARDPRGRYLVFHTGAHLWLLDSDTGTRSELAARSAPLFERGDPCSVERRAAFDATGRHLVYLRGARSHEQVIWHDLASGRELTVAVPDAARPLWRAEPSVSPDWVRLFAIPYTPAATFPRLRDAHDPRRRTSANIISFTQPVTDDRRAIRGLGGHADHGSTPVGQDLLAALHDRRSDLVSFTDHQPALPEDCAIDTGLDGLPTVLLRCNGEDRLWWPQTRQSLRLPGGRLVDAPAHLDADGHPWLAAYLRLRPHETRIVRIDATTTDILTGPQVLLDVMQDGDEPILTDRAGWLLFNSPAGLLALHLATGQAHVHLGLLAPHLRPGAAELQGRWYALDLPRARMHALPHTPAAVAENGCALVGADPSGQHGPWTLHCPQP